jgi:exopolysaccharide biosynthesis polyprenyl glycosylphosphotransferase
MKSHSNNVIPLIKRASGNFVNGSSALAVSDRRTDRRPHEMEAIVGDEPIWIEAKPAEQMRILSKRALDIIGSIIVLLLMAPVLVAVAVAIKLSDKGPVVFKQMRVGLNGKMFTMYKFRTMVQNAEVLKAKLEDKNEMSGPVFKIRHDPRITKIGALLRKTSLDEFPQLFNVIKGEMSLVGPRPPLMSEVKKYKRWQLERLSVKPGITCTWQVSGRNEIGFEDWMRMDVRYARTMTFIQDIKLLYKTFFAVISRRGAH